MTYGEPEWQAATQQVGNDTGCCDCAWPSGNCCRQLWSLCRVRAACTSLSACCSAASPQTAGLCRCNGLFPCLQVLRSMKQVCTLNANHCQCYATLGRPYSVALPLHRKHSCVLHIAACTALTGRISTSCLYTHAYILAHLPVGQLGGCGGGAVPGAAGRQQAAAGLFGGQNRATGQVGSCRMP